MSRNTPAKYLLTKALGQASNPGINPIDVLVSTTPGSGQVSGEQLTDEQGRPLFRVGYSKVNGKCVVR